MMARIFTLCLALLYYCIPAQASLWDRVTQIFDSKSEPPNIRILILHESEGVDLEVKGKYTLYDPYNNSFIGARFIGKKRYLQPMSDGLKWGEAFPGLYQLHIRPDEPSTLTFLEGHPYSGSIYIYDIGGAISVINQIAIEDYITNKLSSQEELKNLHPETLAALAIVARTNAYFQAEHPRNTYWAVDAEKVNFLGADVPEVPEVEEAVSWTHCMIMSATGIYEREATPFLAQLGPISPGASYKNTMPAKISLEQADEMAHQGSHAAQILAKAFPRMVIMRCPAE